MSVEKPSEFDLLSKIFNILTEEKILSPSPTDKIVEFLQPDELKVNFEKWLNNDTALSESELEDVCRQVIRFSLKNRHPYIFSHMFGGVDPYGLAASWLTEAINGAQFTYDVSPIQTIIEQDTINYFLKAFGFNDGEGVLCPGGSLSNIYGILLARYRLLPDVKRTGLFGVKPLVAFTSEDAHYSIKKGMHVTGIGDNNLILIKTDKNGCMIVSDLEVRIKEVIEADKTPFFVSATSGTTVIGAYDDLNGIADVCQKYNIWMHVDACWGGSVIFSKKYSHLLSGINRANSITFNPHKTLCAPLICSIFLNKNKGLLLKCNSANADYLFQTNKFYDASYDLGDLSIQCGRKPSAFKFWLMLKARGTSGLEELVNNSMDCSKYITEQLRTNDGFRLVLSDFQSTNVCFWYIPKSLRGKPEDEQWWSEIYQLSRDITKNIYLSGRAMINTMPLNVKNIGNFMRILTLCQPPPTTQTIDFIIQEIANVGESLCPLN